MGKKRKKKKSQKITVRLPSGFDAYTNKSYIGVSFVIFCIGILSSQFIAFAYDNGIITQSVLGNWTIINATQFIFYCFVVLWLAYSIVIGIVEK